jgi:photosystem II stability/assembly factor-like uncharacterized protein
LWSDVGFSDTGKIYKTTNSGVNWFTYFKKAHCIFDNIIVFNENNVLIQSHYQGSFINEYIKTTNSGNNWNVIYNGTDFRSDSYFINEYTGWSCGNQITKTTNGGYNWSVQYPNPAYSLNGITLKDSLNGWSVGYNGIIIKTTTGGIIFVSSNEENIPSEYSLYQNYPNPFNPTTKIKFAIPQGSPTVAFGDDNVEVAENDRVVLKVYDILGKEIETLVKEKLSAGTYEVTFNASQYPSGVYFYRLITDGYNETKRMILLK